MQFQIFYNLFAEKQSEYFVNLHKNNTINTLKYINVKY